MSTAILKPKGVVWNELSETEQIEICEQMKNITADPNYVKYKYYRTRFNKWIVTNAWAFKMKFKNIFAD
jgi:hypothetical protein